MRRVFELSAEGLGMKAIAKRLNAEGARSPRAQRGRSPTSVRSLLFRDLYRGVVTWNRTRNGWGLQKQAPRPAADWLQRVDAALRIVSEDLWTAAHARLAAVRGVYMKTDRGQAFGRPTLGDPSKYLLTNMALCSCCGGPRRVRSRAHGTGRKFFPRLLRLSRSKPNGTRCGQSFAWKLERPSECAPSC